MKVSLSWLQELVDLKLSPKELAEKLSLASIGVKQFSDETLELDLTYNRGDLLSLQGVAREIAAIIGSQLKFNPAGGGIKAYGADLPKTPVKIGDQKLCPVYCLAKIEGLKVSPSNPDLVKKLADSGIRPVNNIADVTNLVMLEYGQPLHAFDARAVYNESIIVRVAKKGERLTTLDGKTRDLDQGDLLIADEQNVLGLAGVMGGKDSEISNSTTTILLEAAIFDPISIRKTSQRHGLQSEASKRFQHGLTKTNLLQALSAAIKMYEGLGGKLTAINVVGDLSDQPKTLTLTQVKINSLIGLNIPPKFVESALESLGFMLKRTGANVNHPEGGLAWHVISPYFRLDIDIEEDLVEEVARMYGYEKIPAKPLEGALPEKLDGSLQNLIYDLKVGLKEAGLTEVQTYSFYSTDILNNLNYKTDDLVKIANPISSETEYLRNHIWPNLVEIVAKNLKNGFKDVAIFEIGKAYYQTKSEYQEEYKLSIALLNSSENPVYELLQIFKDIEKNLKLDISVGNQIGESADRFHPTRYLYLKHKNQPVGKIGEVHPRILNNLGIEKRVAVLEVNLETITPV